MRHQAVEETGAITIEDLDALRGMVDRRLEAHLDAASSENRLSCAIKHGLLSPGKRLRPLITLLACKQCGAEPEQALSAACAVEMVHAASLIMDDLPSMDNARWRRGALATHVVFGEGAGMLAAIALLNESYALLADCDTLNDGAKLRAIRHLTRAVGIEGLAGGQERDIACSKASSVSLQDMEQRHHEKTGVLFAAAAAIGGECASADAAVVDKLFSFGANLGLAYQAFDDVVDVASSMKEAGKDVSQDADKSTVASLVGADGAMFLANRWLTLAIENAEEASDDANPALAQLAQFVGEKFQEMSV